MKRKRKPHFPRLMSVASPNGEWAVEDEIDSTLILTILFTGGGTMPAKFKPSQKVYKRGVPASQLPVQHFYLKNTPKEELFAEINKSSVKPKQRQKCLNELVRRGIKVQWVSKESV